MRRYVYLMQTLLPVGMVPPAMAEEAPAQAPAVDLMTLNQDERFWDNYGFFPLRLNRRLTCTVTVARMQTWQTNSAKRFG